MTAGQAERDGPVVVALVTPDPIDVAFLERRARPALVAGARLAERADAPLEALLLAPEVERSSAVDRCLARCSRALVAELAVDGDAPLDELLARANLEVGAAVGRWLRERRAAHALFLHDYAAVERLPAVAARAGMATLAGVVALDAAAPEAEDGELVWSRPCHRGKLIERVASPPGLGLAVTVRADGFGDDDARPVPAGDAGGPAWSPLRLPLASATDGGLAWRGDQAAAGEVDLSVARRIVAVGRGLGDPERLPAIEELCRVLDAELAGSRPVIDSGWLPRERQVGSSGATVAPDLYLALGISGASQHLAGMSGARCVAAVNEDPEAPIFRAARFGIVGDLHRIARELVAALAADPTRR